MNTNIKEITIDQLKVGMFIADCNNQWVPDSNFTRKGLVSRPEVIEQIQKLGVKSLYIDVSKGQDCEVAGAEIQGSSTLANLLPEPSVPFKKEMENARKVKTKAVQLIERCMADVKNERDFELGSMKNITQDIMESLSHNYNALACMTQIRQKDRYLMEHSFNVSVLMGILALSLGFEGERLDEVVTGALLHDIGKIRVPDNILNKPDKLSDDEWVEMKNHVTYGEEILNGRSGISPLMLEICSQHHERLNGEGYPRGLDASALSIHARMISIVDVYDAITAERVYHKGMAPTTALKKMLEWDAEFDRELLYHFIEAIGVYPIGTLVELNNHKLAVVLETNATEKAKPKVLQIYDLRTRRYDNKHTIDLADKLCPYHIIKPIYAETYGIKVSDFL